MIAANDKVYRNNFVWKYFVLRSIKRILNAGVVELLWSWRSLPLLWTKEIEEYILESPSEIAAVWRQQQRENLNNSQQPHPPQQHHHHLNLLQIVRLSEQFVDKQKNPLWKLHCNAILTFWWNFRTIRKYAFYYSSTSALSIFLYYCKFNSCSLFLQQLNR